MNRTPIAIVGVPSSAGARRSGQEEGPGALRAAGLVASLRKRGLDVVDRGDLPRAVYRPDADHPRAQNAERVLRVASEVDAAVEAASAGGAFPCVLGGDCTITLGVVAGLLRHGPSLGVLYFDADLDLNTPDTTPSGIFDGMVTAHLLGRGHPPFTRFGPRQPLLEESELAFFGYDAAGEGVDPQELLALERSASPRYPVSEVRADPPGAARRALAALAGRAERFLLHFDVDVTETTAVDVPHRNGLSLAAAESALEVFLASPRCAGLVVTELNPPLDADGAAVRELADRLAAALSGGPVIPPS